MAPERPDILRGVHGTLERTRSNPLDEAAKVFTVAVVHSGQTSQGLCFLINAGELGESAFHG